MLDPLTVTWLSNIDAEGGPPAKPSEDTINAVDDFVKGLKFEGLDDHFLFLNVIVPDNSIAARTPVIAVCGNSTWAQIGLGAGLLGLDGFTPSGNHYWETACVPQPLIDKTNAGATICVTDGGVGNQLEFEMGAGDGSSYFNATADANGNANFGMGGGDGYSPPDDVYLSFFPITGFLSYSITPETGDPVLCTLYQRIGMGALQILANGSVALAQLTDLTWSAPWVFGRNSDGFYSTKTLSLAALHQGLSQAQTNAFSQLFETLRNTLGGGWV